MDPFEALEKVQDAYRTYVFTFQKIKNPVIREWVSDKIAEGKLLWKDPHIQLNQGRRSPECFHEPQNFRKQGNSLKHKLFMEDQ